MSIVLVLSVYVYFKIVDVNYCCIESVKYGFYRFSDEFTPLNFSCVSDSVMFHEMICNVSCRSKWSFVNMGVSDVLLGNDCIVAVVRGKPPYFSTDVAYVLNLKYGFYIPVEKKFCRVQVAIYDKYIVVIYVFNGYIVPHQTDIFCYRIVEENFTYYLDQLWSWRAKESNCVSKPVIYDGLVYIALVGGGLCALNLTSGKVVNKISVGYPISSEIAIYDGVIYLGDSLGNIFRIVNWRVRKLFKAKGEIRGNIRVSNGKVFAYDSLGYIYCLDERTGGVNWIKKIDGRIENIHVCSHGMLAVSIESENGKKTYLLSSLNGSVMEQYDEGCVQSLGNYIVTDRHIIDLGSGREVLSMENGFKFGAIGADKMVIVKEIRDEYGCMWEGRCIITVYKLRGEISVKPCLDRIYLHPGETKELKVSVLEKGFTCHETVNITVKTTSPIEVDRMTFDEGILKIRIRANIFATRTNKTLTVTFTFSEANGTRIVKSVLVNVIVSKDTLFAYYVLLVDVGILIAIIVVRKRPTSCTLSRLMSVLKHS